jgi:predicted PurR-regulated permease PerM
MKPIHFLSSLLILTLVLLWQLFDPFLKSLFVALLLAIATNSIKMILEFKLKSITLVSITMSLLLGLLFFVPLLFFIVEFVNYIDKFSQDELISLFEKSNLFVSSMSNDYQFIKVLLSDILSTINVNQTVTQILSFGSYLGKNTATFIIDMIMILIFYSFFIYYGKSLVSYIKNILPLKKEDSNELFLEVSNVMGVVFYSIIATALLEGLLFGFFVSQFSYDGLLTGILYGFASLIPVVGGAFMWVPIALFEIFSDNVSNAIYIMLYSIIIISIITDTIIKPMIISYINNQIVKTPSKINEILIFFSIITGLSTFGFWGMIIGPATVTFFISILCIIKKHHLVNS